MKTPGQTFASRPMVQWDMLWDEMLSEGSYHSAERWLVDACVLYARAWAYLSCRSNTGSHADAVKAQNRTAARVRKALGFTYPKDEVTF